jgi:GTP pyrophosphokinase
LRRTPTVNPPKVPIAEKRREVPAVPPHFIHLAEVGWVLQTANLDRETIAAGYLHDSIEDRDYSQEQLARAIGDARVAELVAWVSETNKVFRIRREG